MKKVLVTLCIMCMAISAHGVEIPKQGFGVQIGWAQPILRLNDPSGLYPKDSLVNTTKLNGFKCATLCKNKKRRITHKRRENSFFEG